MSPTPTADRLGRPIDVSSFDIRTSRAPTLLTGVPTNHENRTTEHQDRGLTDAYRSSFPDLSSITAGTSDRQRKLNEARQLGVSRHADTTPQNEQVVSGFESTHNGSKSKQGGKHQYAYKYKYKYKYENKYKHSHHGGYGWSYWDCYLWKINAHSLLGVHYYPFKYHWYASWFGAHPCYSSYWWLEWWPYYSYYPSYVISYPTYVPVYESSTVVYYPYYDAPSTSAPSLDTTAGMDVSSAVPRDEVDPAFAAELEALSSNDDAVRDLEQGGEQFKVGDYAGAADSFRRAMLSQPDNAVPKFALAHALFALGEYSYGAFLVRRGMELLPTWPSVGADLRDLYGDPDQLAEHTIALDIFAQSHPDSLDSALLFGYVSFFSGDLDKAQSEFERALTIDPSDRVAPSFLDRVAEIRALLDKTGIPAKDPASLISPKTPAPEPSRHDG